MNFLTKLNPFHRASSARRESNGRVRARFENALTTRDNFKHWATADALSMDAAANPAVRYQLRNRGRQEFHNGSYLAGITETIADYVIGAGPRLQMRTVNKVANKLIDRLFMEWAAEVGLTQILRTSRMARVHSGENFILMGNDPELSSPVQLSLAEIECDRVVAPNNGILPGLFGDAFLDGIELSPYGRPMIYNIMRQHPGGSFTANIVAGYETDPWPAKYVLHDFKPIRPEQRRGVPEIAPALNVFADIRRYSTAVLIAAENAANVNATIETQAGVDVDENEKPADFEDVDLQHGMGMVMPQGYGLKQTKPEQPITTYDGYVLAKLQEAVRCTGLPLMFSTLNPDGANMSASYVVTQPFAKRVKADRTLSYEPMLDRILRMFLDEVMLIPALLPPGSLVDRAHVWHWPSVGEHADPQKVADGHKTKLSCGLASIPEVLAADGQNWEEVQESAAKALGMSLVNYRAALRQSIFATSGAAPPAATAPEPDPIDPDEPDEDPTSAEDDDE